MTTSQGRDVFHKFYLRMRTPGTTDEVLVPFQVLVGDEFREPRTWEEALTVDQYVGVADHRSDPVLVEVSETRARNIDLKLSSELFVDSPEVYNEALRLEEIERNRWDFEEGIVDAEIVETGDTVPGGREVSSGEIHEGF